MKVGDLVKRKKWKITRQWGVIRIIHSNAYCNVFWLDGDTEWLCFKDLEVINESR
jgi:prepilin-type processing-associated H-X9-DG protein